MMKPKQRNRIQYWLGLLGCIPFLFLINSLTGGLGRGEMWSWWDFSLSIILVLIWSGIWDNLWAAIRTHRIIRLKEAQLTRRWQKQIPNCKVKLLNWTFKGLRLK